MSTPSSTRDPLRERRSRFALRVRPEKKHRGDPGLRSRRRLSQRPLRLGHRRADRKRSNAGILHPRLPAQGEEAPLRIVLVFALAGCLLGGCVSPTDPLGREDALQESQRKYTELIRWGDVERAVQYVVPEMRDEFLKLAAKMSHLRITDYDIGEIEFGERSASVTVVYRGYVIAQALERSGREQQEWVRDGIKNSSWQVRPQLQEVVDALEGLPPSAAR
jgi:hypothetical protein